MHVQRRHTHTSMSPGCTFWLFVCWMGPTLLCSGAVLTLLQPDSWDLGHVRGTPHKVGGVTGQCFGPHLCSRPSHDIERCAATGEKRIQTPDVIPPVLRGGADSCPPCLGITSSYTGPHRKGCVPSRGVQPTRENECHHSMGLCRGRLHSGLRILLQPVPPPLSPDWTGPLLCLQVSLAAPGCNSTRFDFEVCPIRESPAGVGGSEGGRTPSAPAAACLPPPATLSPGALFLFSVGATSSWGVGRQGKTQVSRNMGVE